MSMPTQVVQQLGRLDGLDPLIQQPQRVVSRLVQPRIVRNTPLFLKVLQADADPKPAILLLGESFDMLDRVSRELDELTARSNCRLQPLLPRWLTNALSRATS